MLERNPDSRKGDNGKVLVIGGSERFYGAPILCALAAEAAGVDLIFPCLPAEHMEAAKQYSLNFILHSFKGPHLGVGDVKSLLNLSRQADAAVIGPGLGTHPGTQEAVKQLLKELAIPTVVDAGALLYTSALPPSCVLTPHRGEFQRLTGEEAIPESVQKWAASLGAVILCKGSP